MNRIRVTLGGVVVTATLNDSNTARLLWGALPFESTARRWGDEVYFQTPVDTGDENAQADVSAGAVAYWPSGKALCLFFGQTPYSPVNVVGELDGDPCALTETQDGEMVRIEGA